MKPLRSLSIVIPTHNRADVLGRCLGALCRQEALPADAEIIVVDDGSEDETRAAVAAGANGAPVPIHYLWQAASGPAAARNRGIRAASGHIVLFLGDDIIAGPRLVSEHLSSHTAFPDVMIGVLGFVTWSDRVPVSPYMRWLESSGEQFAYGTLDDRSWVDPSRYLYTSNLSLKRRAVAESGEWFDERFRHALLEDIDLGRRLASHGFTLYYNRAAGARHEHAIELRHYARRIERSSEYWVLLEKKRNDAVPGAEKVPMPARRNYVAYAGFLLRVSAEVIGNWPFWWVARFCEHRRVAPTAFRRAHHFWAQRGLLRLEARKVAKLVGTA
ncbi:MAG: glycosyltransferase family 2 protein [Vicinamibacterales bacterium]